MARESVLLSVAVSLLLEIRGVEAMSMKFMMEVLVGAFESTWLSNNMRIVKLKSKIALKKSEFDAAAVELKSIKCRLCFAEDAVNLLQAQAQSQAPQLRKVDAAHGACQAAWTDAKCKIQSLTASESASQGEAAQLARGVEELGDELAKMSQERDHKVQDVLFDCVVQHLHLNSMASQLSVARRYLTAPRERLEQHFGRSAARHLRVESLLSSSVSSFVDRVTSFVSEEVAAYHATLTDLVASVSDSLESDSQSDVDLLCAAEHGGRCVQLTERRQERLLLCPWNLVTIDMQVSHVSLLVTSVVSSL